MGIHTPEMTATETVPADAEIAVTETAAIASLTAPDSPAAAAPDVDRATDAEGRVAAVWAALNAEPGGSATAIGAAAGLSRMAAGKILNDFEANNRAHREPGVSEGGRGRTADRWFPIALEPSLAINTNADAEPTGSADASAPAPEMPDAAPEAIPAPDMDTPDGDMVPAPDTAPVAIDSVDPGPAGEPTDEDLIADEVSSQDSDGTDAGPDSALNVDTDASKSFMDDPAWAHARAALTELADLFNGVISAKDEGNVVMALGCLEMAMTKATSAHRNARAVLTGTATPTRPVMAARPGASGGGSTGDTVRPGVLRDLVYAHLVAFPDKDFTPYEIGKVISRSSGAVANALDRLVSLGEAMLTCERPRRFGLAPTAKPAPADTHDTDDDAA